jgi:secondary thiamine-phosphate synthase enzyme
MNVKTESIQVSTKGFTDVIDLTSQVNDIVNQSGMQSGSATVFVSGSTAGLTTIEYEPGLVQDIKEAFERIAPADGNYKHHATWRDDNGNSHVRASLLGPTLVVPFANKNLILGTWQQIVLIDFDTRSRNRDIVVQLMGT